MKQLLAIPCLLLFFAGTVHADYLEVRRSSNIYTEPMSTSALVKHVEPGLLLPLLESEQTNGYYKVRLSPEDVDRHAELLVQIMREAYGDRGDFD